MPAEGDCDAGLIACTYRVGSLFCSRPKVLFNNQTFKIILTYDAENPSFGRVHVGVMDWLKWKEHVWDTVDQLGASITNTGNFLKNNV